MNMVSNKEGNKQPGIICVYCGMNPATEEDHVIARQFFPADEEYRSNLPKVPSCSKCNRQKQKVEDPSAVIWQFGDASLGSEAVLKNRVPKTLKKNQRLARALKNGLSQEWVKQSNGIFVKGLTIELSEEDLFCFNRWFIFVTKGLYYHELKRPIPPEHELQLIKPESKQQYDILCRILLNTPNLQRHSFANGEFKYAFAINDAEELTMWAFAFKSIEVFAVTAGPSCPIILVSRLKDIAWKEESPVKRNSCNQERGRIILPSGYNNSSKNT